MKSTDEKTRIAGVYWTGRSWVTVSRVTTGNGAELTLRSEGESPLSPGGNVIGHGRRPEYADVVAQRAIQAGWALVGLDRSVHGTAFSRAQIPATSSSPRSDASSAAPALPLDTWQGPDAALAAMQQGIFVVPDDDRGGS